MSCNFVKIALWKTLEHFYNKIIIIIMLQEWTSGDHVSVGSLNLQSLYFEFPILGSMYEHWEYFDILMKGLLQAPVVSIAFQELIQMLHKEWSK